MWKICGCTSSLMLTSAPDAGMGVSNGDPSIFASAPFSAHIVPRNFLADLRVEQYRRLLHNFIMYRRLHGIMSGVATFLVVPIKNGLLFSTSTLFTISQDVVSSSFRVWRAKTDGYLFFSSATISPARVCFCFFLGAACRSLSPKVRVVDSLCSPVPGVLLLYFSHGRTSSLNR